MTPLDKLSIAVCQHYIISKEELCGKSRKRPLPLARQVFGYIATLDKSVTQADAAKYLGYNQPDMVSRGIRTLQDLIFSDKKVKEDVYKIHSLIVKPKEVIEQGFEIRPEIVEDSNYFKNRISIFRGLLNNKL